MVVPRFISAFGVAALLLLSSPAAQADPAPLSVSPAIFQLGALKEGEKRDLAIEVRNPLDISLHVNQVVSGCGCVVVTGIPVEIPAYGKAQVIVRLDTEGLRGSTERSLRLFTSHPSQPLITVPLKFAVQPVVAVEPAILSTERLLVTDVEDFSQILHVAGNEVESVSAAPAGSGDDDSLMVTPLPSTRQDGWKFRVAPSGPSLPIGEVRDRIFVQAVLRNGTKKLVVVPVFWDVISPISLAKARLNFGAKHEEQRVRVAVLGNTPIELSGVNSSSDIVQASISPLEDGRLYEVVVTLDRASLREPLRSVITFESKEIDSKNIPNIAVAAVPQKVR